LKDFTICATDSIVVSPNDTATSVVTQYTNDSAGAMCVSECELSQSVQNKKKAPTIPTNRLLELLLSEEKNPPNQLNNFFILFVLFYVHSF
jgi:hypothetical protein